MILEAKCLKCGQIFNPHSEVKEDLEHGVDNQGTPCGGAGELLGRWTQTGDSGLSVEALDAGLEALTTHTWQATIDGHAVRCACGVQYDTSDNGGAAEADRKIRLHKVQVILEAVFRQGGVQQWRVTGDPGPQFGLYSFTWPRRGSNENGEDMARKFIAMFHEPGRTPWPDGPHLHHRTVYLHEGDWIPDTPQEPQ